MTDFFNQAPAPDAAQGCNKEVLVARFDSMDTRFAIWHGVARSDRYLRYEHGANVRPAMDGRRPEPEKSSAEAEAQVIEGPRIADESTVTPRVAEVTIRA